MGISKSFQKPLTILIFGKIEKKTAFQHVPISTPTLSALGKLNRRNIRARIDRPIWRWKDVGKNKK
jgi:hypothetical protein